MLTASSTTIGSADEGSRSDPNPYRSPLDLAYSPDGALLAVSDRSAREAVIFDARKGSVARRVPLRGEPTGVAFAADRTLLVAEYDAGSVAAIDLEEGAVTRRYAVGLRPMGIALSHSRGLLVAANTVSDDVSIVDLTTGEERARIRAPREPFFVAVSPDGRKAAVTNLLPRG
ncbi:MAG TPA: hypothetical protein VK116_12705, partial [Planctomycetota bacterium]|nr:hypothetical protein [Planctomycetota bacterium]